MRYAATAHSAGQALSYSCRDLQRFREPPELLGERAQRQIEMNIRRVDEAKCGDSSLPLLRIPFLSRAYPVNAHTHYMQWENTMLSARKMVPMCGALNEPIGKMTYFIGSCCGIDSQGVLPHSHGLPARPPSPSRFAAIIETLSRCLVVLLEQ